MNVAIANILILKPKNGVFMTFLSRDTKIRACGRPLKGWGVKKNWWHIYTSSSLFNK